MLTHVRGNRSKQDTLNILKRVIQATSLTTQTEVQRHLASEGVILTQGCISRYLRDLGAYRRPINGTFTYVVD